MPENKVIKETTEEDKLLQKLNSAKNTLDKLFEESDRVFITGHLEPDMDAIGAAIGMSLLCKKNKRKSYIVVDEPIEKNAREFILETKDEIEYISASQVPELLTDKSMLISVDNNKVGRTSVKDYLNRFQSVFILDHHNEDEGTIKTPYKCIDTKFSSTCEAVSVLAFLSRAKLPQHVTNYLYAGIKLDTKDFTKNVSTSLSHQVAGKLILKGANLKYIKRWFKRSPEEDQIIQELTSKAVVYPYTYAVSCVTDENKTYSSVDLAKAADALLNYDFSAIFVIAKTDEDSIAISARSNGDVDVGKIMSCYNLVKGGRGGGTPISAGAQVKGRTIEEVRKILSGLLIPCNIVTEQQPTEGQKQLLLTDQKKTTD